MSKPTDPPGDWDSRCLQCGRCCFEKYYSIRGKVIYTDIPCRYLDVATRQCKIFDRRAEINPLCVQLTPELLPKLDWLPDDCGYMTAVAERPSRPSRRRR